MVLLHFLLEVPYCCDSCIALILCQWPLTVDAPASGPACRDVSRLDI